MSKKQIIGLTAAAMLFILTGVISVFSNRFAEKMLQSSLAQVQGGEYTFQGPNSDYIAIVKIEGTIQEEGKGGIFNENEGYRHEEVIKYIDYLMDDGNNKGILLYVDSPGGSVYESEELYRKLTEYKTAAQRPIWNYMAHYAASGGYYVSTAAERIYANPNTVTGSIGVIMTAFDLTGLYEKLGIEYTSITSGKYKDSSRMTDELKAIYQGQIDEMYERFLEVVSQGRGLSMERTKALADGRTYTAKQALENGLIDEIGLYEEVKDSMSLELGVSTFYEPERKRDMGLGALLGILRDIVPESEGQTLERLANETRGGLQYYADIQ